MRVVREVKVDLDMDCGAVLCPACHATIERIIEVPIMSKVARAIGDKARLRLFACGNCSTALPVVMS